MDIRTGLLGGYAVFCCVVCWSLLIIATPASLPSLPHYVATVTTGYLGQVPDKASDSAGMYQFSVVALSVASLLFTHVCTYVVWWTRAPRGHEVTAGPS